MLAIVAMHHSRQFSSELTHMCLNGAQVVHHNTLSPLACHVLGRPCLCTHIRCVGIKLQLFFWVWSPPVHKENCPKLTIVQPAVLTCYYVYESQNNEPRIGLSITTLHTCKLLCDSQTHLSLFTSSSQISASDRSSCSHKSD